jgi:excisionase family DNA binding protein
MLIDADAAAALVNCSTRHWRRMVDEGKAPKPIRVGTLVRWNKQTVLEWITDGCPAFKASRGRRDHRL